MCLNIGSRLNQAEKHLHVSVEITFHMEKNVLLTQVMEKSLLLCGLTDSMKT